MQIEIPPTSGMAPWWCLRALGLSTRPIFLANLRIMKIVAREKKNKKERSRNGMSTTKPNDLCLQ